MEQKKTRKKIERFWITNAQAKSFMAWCKKKDDLEVMEPVVDKFTPEVGRCRYVDAKYGHATVFMLYFNKKYNCVNVPSNTKWFFLTFAGETGIEVDGKLGTARGDGKDDASKAKAKATREAEKAKAKKAAAAKKKQAAKTRNKAKPKKAKPKAKAKK